jgi:hypothetical protein
VLAIHFLSHASLLIQKLWLSTWEGGLHLVIATGKWDLWWEPDLGSQVWEWCLRPSDVCILEISPISYC